MANLPPPTGISVPPLPPETPPEQLALPEAPPVVATPFVSPLKLTAPQFTKAESETLMRIQELKREVGLTPLNEVIPGSWMWLRKIHEACYQGDLSWRLAMGGIFPLSNFTLGSGLRHVRYMSARVQDDLLGTSPFFAALGRNQDKEKLAKQVEEYVQGEIEGAGVRKGLRQAQKIALYRNECVVKTGYLDDFSHFSGEATVLVDDATGEPIITPEKGLYVYEDDDTIDSPTVQGMGLLATDPSFQMAQQMRPDGQPTGNVTIPSSIDQKTGEVIPERVSRFQHFDELPNQILSKQKGVVCKPLDYRSFLCPLKVESIHDADTVAHLYLETPNELKKRFGGIDTSKSYFSFWDNPGQDRPKYEQGEQGNPPTAIYQQVVVGEVYRRFDPDETGEDREIFMVFDLTNSKLIYYNFLANHMKKRPFEPVPGIELVPGRWYGRGIYGMLEDHLLYEDAELNRANFKNSKDATIQFGYKAACESWKTGAPPIVGSKDTIWLNDNWNPEGGKKPIFRENLYEKIETDLEMMNTMRQSADSLIGAMSAQSANQSDFNQSKTATGNQLIQQASDVITKATEQEQIEAINEILSQVVEVLLEHMDKTSLRFAKDSDELVTLNRNECRSMERDVRLLLTRSRSTQLLSTSQQALGVAKDYRMMMLQDPEGAKILREVYIAQLKAMEIPDADQICPEITDEMIQQFQQSQQQKPPEKPPSETLNYKDSPESIKRQIEAQAGLRPATPQDLAQDAQRAATEKAASQPPTVQKAA